MRNTPMIVIASLSLLIAGGCASPAPDLGLAPGESAVLLRSAGEGGPLVAVPVTRGERGFELGPRLTLAQPTAADAECHTDDQGHTECECDWGEHDVGTFGSCALFALAGCEPGTLEPTDGGYTCEGAGDP